MEKQIRVMVSEIKNPTIQLVHHYNLAVDITSREISKGLSVMYGYELEYRGLLHYFHTGCKLTTVLYIRY
jgi:hypothetical protein